MFVLNKLIKITFNLFIMAKEVSNQNVTYFKVDADGYIYQRSATQLEGYKPYYDKDSKLLGYKKIYSATDTGKIKDLCIRVAEFSSGGVKMVSLTIEGENGLENIQFPLLTQSKTLSPYAKSLATILPNVDFEGEYSISFDKRKDDKGFTYKNIYFNIGDNNFVRSFHKYPNKENNNGADIPPMEKSESITGDVVWDSTKQDKFLMDFLKAQIERFHSKTGASETPSVNPEPVGEAVVEKAKPKKEVLVEEDDDDLPF